MHTGYFCFAKQISSYKTFKLMLFVVLWDWLVERDGVLAWVMVESTLHPPRHFHNMMHFPLTDSTIPTQVNHFRSGDQMLSHLAAKSVSACVIYHLQQTVKVSQLHSFIQSHLLRFTSPLSTVYCFLKVANSLS